MGRYYAPDGGAPEKMTKQVPIKDIYYDWFVNPAYSVLLYRSSEFFITWPVIGSPLFCCFYTAKS